MRSISLLSLAALWGVSQIQGVQATNGLPDFLGDERPITIPLVKKLGSSGKLLLRPSRWDDLAAGRNGSVTISGSRCQAGDDDCCDNDDGFCEDAEDSEEDDGRELCAPQPSGHGPMPRSVPRTIRSTARLTATQEGHRRGVPQLQEADQHRQESRYAGVLRARQRRPWALRRRGRGVLCRGGDAAGLRSQPLLRDVRQERPLLRLQHLHVLLAPSYAGRADRRRLRARPDPRPEPQGRLRRPAGHQQHQVRAVGQPPDPGHGAQLGRAPRGL